MGRHVNFEDEQDRWLNKADKLNRNNKKEIPLMELNFNDMVTLKDQLEWIRLKKRQTENARRTEGKVSTEEAESLRET